MKLSEESTIINKNISNSMGMINQVPLERKKEEKDPTEKIKIAQSFDFDSGR
jgi:hypothetical protein